MTCLNNIATPEKKRQNEQAY